MNDISAVEPKLKPFLMYRGEDMREHPERYMAQRDLQLKLDEWILANPLVKKHKEFQALSDELAPFVSRKYYRDRRYELRKGGRLHDDQIEADLERVDDFICHEGHTGRGEPCNEGECSDEETRNTRLTRWGRGAVAGATPPFSTDKKHGGVSWREWSKWMQDGQTLQSKASMSQDMAHVTIPTDKPIMVLPFSDTHMGSWASDVGLFEAITDEILATPNVYVLLLGDLVEMAIKLRGVGEVTNQVMRPDQQLDFVEDWLGEIGHRVLAATWDNHAIMREEAGSGFSQMKALLKRRFVYHDGIGHLDVTVGQETYKLALTHKFRGNSYMNRTHGPSRYMRFEGSDREIAIQGDIHTPGKSVYYDGPMKRLAITCGTLHTASLYGRRHFSLFAIPAFPCFELFPDQHRFVDYWSLGDWKASRGIAA